MPTATPKALAILVAAALIVSASAATLWAMYCPTPHEMDTWHLQLVEVTVDGETVDDLGDYHNLHFTLVSRFEADHLVVSKDRYQPSTTTFRNVPRAYSIPMSPGLIPEHLDAHLSDEAGAP